MTKHTALLGACLALPLAAWAGTALAGQPQTARTITVPPGAMVLIVPAGAPASGFVPVARQPAADPMLQLIAQQDAMMHDMMAEMDAAFAQPMFPHMDQMIQAALRGTPLPAGAGNGVVFTSVSNGPGVCIERMDYVYPANGGKPQVAVSRSGNACGTLGTAGPLHVMQTTPISPPQATPLAPSHGPRMWTVSDPPQPIVPQGSPRT
jgi:hypothetical protein